MDVQSGLRHKKGFPLVDNAEHGYSASDERNIAEHEDSTNDERNIAKHKDCK